MEFVSTDPSAVRSIKQRHLLNEWLRAIGKRCALPLRRDFQPDRMTDELVDMMGYDVIGHGHTARFRITQQGARLAATYGNDRMDPNGPNDRFLDDAIGPERYARIVTLYRACLIYRRPVYSISTVQDADGKDVSYERLLLPFGSGDEVEQIVGSFKSISIEGGFKIDNLMGLRPKAEPVIQVRAVIDREFVPGSAALPDSDEVVELD
ncbi:MAG: PAS domain-containing protein [bacterium]|nr:PAS domain-containing protein [bacterium]